MALTPSERTTLLLSFISFLLVFVAAHFIFKPDPSEQLRDLAKKDLQKQELIHKRIVDSIQNLRKKELADHKDQLIIIDSKLSKIKKKIDQQDQKIKSYEKELATYRSGNFDERFRSFSDLVRKNIP